MSTPVDDKRTRPQRRAAAATSAWLERNAAAQPSTNGHHDAAAPDSSVHSLPRREQLIDPAHGRMSLPLVEATRYKTSFWRSVGRLFTWLRVFAAYLLGN